MSARKSSHRTIFLIVSSGSPLALIASSLRSTSKKPVCPMTRSLHPPMAHCGQRVRFAATWREEFFEVPFRPKDIPILRKAHDHRPAGAGFKETYPTQDQRAHNALPKLCLADQQCAQSVRRDDQGLDLFLRVRIDESGSARK